MLCHGAGAIDLGRLLEFSERSVDLALLAKHLPSRHLLGGSLEAHALIGGPIGEFLRLFVVGLLVELVGGLDVLPGFRVAAFFVKRLCRFGR